MSSGLVSSSLLPSCPQTKQTRNLLLLKTVLNERGGGQVLVKWGYQEGGRRKGKELHRRLAIESRGNYDSIECAYPLGLVKDYGRGPRFTTDFVYELKKVRAE